MELSTPDEEPGGALAGLQSLYVEPERPTEIDWGALEFHDVFKIYRSGPAETVALRGLDLRIEPREMVAIVGPREAGRARCWPRGGDGHPSAGEVRAFGRSLSRLGENELADISRSPDSDRLSVRQPLAGLLGAREVATALRLAGRSDAESAASEALEAFGLGERQHLRPAALSGGEQQRVAIAGAAARRARLVLADEPTGELDERNEAIVLEALRELRDVYDTTVLVVTHADRVAGACDRVVPIRDGRVEV